MGCILLEMSSRLTFGVLSRLVPLILLTNELGNALNTGLNPFIENNFTIGCTNKNTHIKYYENLNLTKCGFGAMKIQTLEDPFVPIETGISLFYRICNETTVVSHNCLGKQLLVYQSLE